MKNMGAILSSLTFAACILVLLVSCAKKVELAKTPPMGWNTWNRFG